jgi:hypothetical protein
VEPILRATASVVVIVGVVALRWSLCTWVQLRDQSVEVRRCLAWVRLEEHCLLGRSRGMGLLWGLLLLLLWVIGWVVVGMQVVVYLGRGLVLLLLLMIVATTIVLVVAASLVVVPLIVPIIII